MPVPPLVVALSIKHGDGDIEVPRLVLVLALAREPGQPGEQPRRLALLVAVVVAHTARRGRVLVGAGLAGVEIRQRLAEIVLDHLELHDLLADLRLLLGEQRADPRGGLAPRVGVLEIADEPLDLGEREADRLELDDPVDAIDRLRPIHAKSALGSRAWL